MIPLVSKLPKGCTKDCRNGDESCCEKEWRACKSWPYGNCTTKNCIDNLKCKDILGCKEQEGTGDCIASSSPSPSPSGGGCYRFDGTVCEFLSPDSCSAMPHYNKLCKHGNGNCYNSEQACLNAHHSPSPPSHSPHHHLPITPNTPWNSDSIEFIMSNLPNRVDDIPKNQIPVLFHCLINKAQKNNITPYEFIKGDLSPTLQDSMTKECLKTVRGESPSSPPSPPSPSSFLSTTTGKIIVIVIIMLVLLALIWLTYVVTKKKK